jgi:predicted hydrocarbon binding protein
MRASYFTESGNRVNETKTSNQPLLAVPPRALLALRKALLTRPDLDTVFALRDAAYAGGDAMYDAFKAYVDSSDAMDPQELEVNQFFRRAGEFWTQSGWGRTTFSEADDAFCAVEIDGCWEAHADDQPDPRGCHLTVGIIGAFLGKFADYPVSVLEVEGPATDSERCRFLAGSMAMIAAHYAENS